MSDVYLLGFYTLYCKIVSLVLHLPLWSEASFTSLNVSDKIGVAHWMAEFEALAPFTLMRENLYIYMDRIYIEFNDKKRTQSDK